VRIRGVVTYVRYRGYKLFVQDTTGGIYCTIPLDQPDVTSGDEVEVRGTRSGGIFAPMIENTQLKFLRHGTLPRPQKPTAEKIISQRFDSRWIEMEESGSLLSKLAEQIPRFGLREARS